MAEKNEDKTREYNSLVSQKSQKQKEYTDCENRIEDYDYLLKRLRRAKTDVEAMKGDFGVFVSKEDKQTKRDHDDQRQWQGSNFTDFHASMKELEDINTKYYKKSLDHVLDSINNEITRLQNARMNEYGLLGKLGSAINSLANKIENFFN